MQRPRTPAEWRGWDITSLELFDSRFLFYYCTLRGPTPLGPLRTRHCNVWPARQNIFTTVAGGLALRGFTTAVSILSILLIVGCDANETVAPDTTESERLVPEHLRRSTIVGDSVHWINNYAAAEDLQGDFWEWEREGSNGIYPEVRIYKNGDLVGTFNMEYDTPYNPKADTIRTPDGGWADRKADGTITKIGPREGMILPTGGVLEAGLDFGLSKCVSLIGILLPGPCDDEKEAAQRAAWQTAANGLVGMAFNIASGGITTPFTFFMMSARTADTMSKLGQYIYCELTH